MIKTINLAKTLKTGDMIYLQDKTIIRYDDCNITMKELKSLEPQIRKITRNKTLYIFRQKSGNKYGNKLKLNPEFKNMCREKEISL